MQGIENAKNELEKPDEHTSAIWIGWQKGGRR